MTPADPAERQDERFTCGQYYQWDDGERWELINGVPYNMAPVPLRRHQRILLKVSLIIEKLP